MINNNKYAPVLSFICGFASLSVEILWVRLYGFSRYSIPLAFGFVLMAYLIGIAIGAHMGSRACKRNADHSVLWKYSIILLGFAGILTFMLPALFGWMTSHGIEDPLSAFLVISSSSVVIAFIFPIAHHLGADQGNEGKQGRRFAAVYTSNVLGAALGPLVTGYLLLDSFSLQNSFAIIGVFQLIASMVLSLLLLKAHHRSLATLFFAVVTVILVVLTMKQDPHELVQMANQNPGRAKTIVENRHGIITIIHKKEGDDAIFGGNVYDGTTNLDPGLNTNGLQRPLLAVALHPEPKRVLMVGLSIGTWLALVNTFQDVQHIDVVEINPGYLDAAKAYPFQSEALRDPRVNVVVDDARRWLRNNKNQKYDVVIMNTTWHWRANSSLLLSSDFMEIVKHRMAEGAILAFNATGSGDAFYTAANVFPNVYRYKNFVYAANFDFRAQKNSRRIKDLYSALKIQGKEFFNSGSISKIDEFLNEPFVELDLAQKAATRKFEKVTDQNMLTEFKYGEALY
ncbi:spermidine synthase [Acidovorax sp. LjRoot118]|uniref:spermidine synthase n=1 Tax=unclassified Acidovorax TaxID=2684926 RepID=UPI0009E730E1|nr:spermidine synthase [Acidovorax sp. Root217]